uniref:heme exporter protein CcmB n=1 Tax=Salmonella enterica TaxID=28901 RepID=UPI001FEE693F
LPVPLPAVVLAKVLAHWAVTGLPLIMLSPLVARLTRRMAAHTAQGGMVILTTHQPLPGAADTVRRLALTGGGAGL